LLSKLTLNLTFASARSCTCNIASLHALLQCQTTRRTTDSSLVKIQQCYNINIVEIESQIHSQHKNIMQLWRHRHKTTKHRNTVHDDKYRKKLHMKYSTVCPKIEPQRCFVLIFISTRNSEAKICNRRRLTWGHGCQCTQYYQ